MRTAQPARARRWTTAALATVALVAGGCGLGGDPSVSSTEDVVAALVTLGEQSGQTRLSASIDVDEGELRALLREQPTLLDLLATDLPLEIDELLARLREAQATVDRVALLGSAGEDGSFRYSIEVDDEVVVDLRGRADAGAERDDPLAPVEATYQAMVDLDRLAALADELASADAGDGTGSDTLGLDRLAGARDSLDGLRSTVLAVVPDAAPLLDLVAAALDGELVEVTGTLDPRAWLGSTAPAFGADPSTVEDELGSLLDRSVGGEGSEIDPAELLATLFSFDGFRTEGSSTVVDVGVELRRGGDWLLARLDERLVEQDEDGGDGPGGTVEELREGLDELRAALDDAPDRLEDVGTLRFGPEGELQQARLELLDVAARLASAAAEDDVDAAMLADAAAGLERTGVFLTLDVTGIGELPTVLGDASTTVTFDELREVVDSVAATFGGLLGGLAGGFAGDGLLDVPLDPGSSGDGTDGLGDLLGGGELGLRPDEVPVGACFDDGALFAGDGDATTVPCEEPHDNEVFAIVELGGATDPYDPTVALTASSRCDEPFEQYVGTPYVESAYFHATIVPTQREWDEDGLRAAVCYLFAFEPQVGSAAGSGR